MHCKQCDKQYCPGHSLDDLYEMYVEDKSHKDWLNWFNKPKDCTIGHPREANFVNSH